MDEQKGNNTYKIVSITIIGLLLALSGYLLYQKSQSSNVIASQDATIMEIEKGKADVEKTYYEALADLEEMKGDREDMNSRIDSQKIELKKQRDQIVNLLATSKDYKAIKARIATMKSESEEFRRQLEALKAENQELAMSNEQLNTEKGLLAGQVNQERTSNDELAARNANLEATKTGLESEKASLAKKVDKASVIKISDILVEGYKLSTKGKEVSKRFAKNIDGIKICFKTAQNELVESGREKFYIRIINPTGETINIPAAGSGVIPGSDDGTEISYSLIKEFTYENTAAVSCTNWQPTYDFVKGSYEIYVYNKGYLAGKSTFTLK